MVKRYGSVYLNGTEFGGVVPYSDYSALERENEALREALQFIASREMSVFGYRREARAALERTGGGVMKAPSIESSWSYKIRSLREENTALRKERDEYSVELATKAAALERAQKRVQYGMTCEKENEDLRAILAKAQNRIKAARELCEGNPEYPELAANVLAALEKEDAS